MSSLQTESVLSKIHERGYWRVVIRPTRFIEKRILDYADLFPLVEKIAVRWRVWGYPCIKPGERPRHERDRISQEIDQDWFIEMWRFYQSGQFFHAFGIVEDWRDQSSLWPADESWEAGADLGLEYTIFRLTEIFEFAARLSLTDAGDDFLHIEIGLNGLSGRKIKGFGSGRLHLVETRSADIPEYPQEFELSRADLIARPKELALEAASDLFKCFDWNPPKEVLREIQSGLVRR